MDEVKVCTKCCESKPLSEFFTRSGGKPHSACKKCHIADGLRYRAENREQTNETAREWQRANRERVAATAKRWRERHPEKAAEVNRKMAEKRKANPYQVSVTEKTCSSCKEMKVADQFRVNPRLKSGLNSCCKSCESVKSARWAINHKERRRQRRKEFRKEQPELHKQRSKERYDKAPHIYKQRQMRRNYGIGLSEYNELFESQSGRCAIRGLLCTNCNNGLGRFKDNIEFLTKAIIYLSNKRSP